MPRVIAGSAKGRRLDTVEGDVVRPTADRVKEALFSILGDRVPGADVIDVCAGSGGLGIEALSRGARFCTFVETDRRCIDVIRRNLSATHLDSYARVVPMAGPHALRTLANEPGGGVDLILADPPYGEQDVVEEILRAAADSGILRPGGTLCLETTRKHAAAPPVPPLTVWQEKTYGKTRLVFYRSPRAAS